MKLTIYIFLFCLCFSLNISAQKYSTMVMEDWKNGNWINAMKMTNTFDSNGNIIKESTETWDDVANVWENAGNTTHTLNANSTINYSMTQSWNKDLGMWEDMQKTVYTYDGSKNVLTQKTQMLFGTDWMDYSLTTNTYNGSGQLITTIVSILNFMTMQMDNFTQTNYSYNPDGTENQTIFQQWGETSGTWENSNRHTSTYNASKVLTTVLTEDYTAGGWINSMKSTLTLNANGSVKESLGQDWNVSSSTWVDSGKELYTQYADGSTNQITTTSWNTTLAQWENQSRITYTYNSTFVHQLEAGQIKVFPNPFTDVLSIEYNSINETNIQLYNANGQLVRTFDQAEHLSPINLSWLKNGVYLLKINTPESQNVIKLLKIK